MTDIRDEDVQTIARRLKGCAARRELPTWAEIEWLADVVIASPPQESVGVGVQDDGFVPADVYQVMTFPAASPPRGVGAPDGWQCVPKEPTPDMRIDGGIAWSNALHDAETYVDTADACYKAMLSASKEKTEGQLNPPGNSAVEAEAERIRIILDTEPPNDNSDMLYAAYNALLFVLGYGVYPPSENWGMSSDERRERWLNRAKLPDDRRQNLSTPLSPAGEEKK